MIYFRDSVTVLRNARAQISQYYSGDLPRLKFPNRTDTDIAGGHRPWSLPPTYNIRKMTALLILIKCDRAFSHSPSHLSRRWMGTVAIWRLCLLSHYAHNLAPGVSRHTTCMPLGLSPAKQCNLQIPA